MPSRWSSHATPASPCVRAVVAASHPSSRRHFFLRFLPIATLARAAAAMLLLVALGAPASTPVRIVDTPPAPAGAVVAKHLYVFGEPARLRGGVFRWRYNPANEPAALGGRALAILRSAAAAWTRQCDVRVEYLGLSSEGVDAYDDESVVSWGATGVGGAAAVTFVRVEPAGAGLALGDADIRLEVGALRSESELYSVAVHEFGHAIGLAHSDRENAVMSGPPRTTYTHRGDLRLDDLEGCQALYNNGGCAGAKPVEERYTEAGSCPAGMQGGMQYRRSAYCANGSWTMNAWERVGNRCSEAVPTAKPSATLREYFREATGTYFLTADDVEQRALDDGVIAGWQATGQAWAVWTEPSESLVPVCRFYGGAGADDRTGPRRGPDSHFYTADTDECDQLPSRFPVWGLESRASFRVALPVGGACPVGTVAASRYFRPWGDPTHRYATDGAIAMSMLAQGWSAEGTAFCLPQ